METEKVLSLVVKMSFITGVAIVGWYNEHRKYQQEKRWANWYRHMYIKYGLNNK